jgi:hypothetical protein
VTCGNPAISVATAIRHPRTRGHFCGNQHTTSH